MPAPTHHLKLDVGALLPSALLEGPLSPRGGAGAAGGWPGRLRAARRAAASTVAFEARVMHAFNRRDWPFMMMAPTLVSVMLFASGNSDVSPLFTAVFSTLTLYFFTLMNQLVDVQGDRIDNPTRPIPSGLVSEDGAVRRMLVVASLFALCGVATDNAGHVILQVALFLAYNYLGFDAHFLPKSVMATASVADLIVLGAGSFAGSAAFQAWLQELSVCACLLLMLGQDTRDVKGDAALGRMTLPLAIGVETTRTLNAVFLLSFPALHAAWVAEYRCAEGGAALPYAVDAGMAALVCVCAYRTLMRREREDDCLTWRLTSVWLPLFCLTSGWLCPSPSPSPSSPLHSPSSPFPFPFPFSPPSLSA